MTWQGILGHDVHLERFRRAVARGRLAGSLLFVGEPGIGKRTFAFALARSLLCQKNDETVLDACGTCHSCSLFPEHPDFFYVAKPEDKAFIPLELFVGDKEHRGQAGLCYNISKTPYLGKRKIVVIDDTDFFNAEGANALLKTLEEPPPDSLLILIGSSIIKQLPTIRSRCQIIRFTPPSRLQLATLLEKQGVVESLETGLRLVDQTKGGLQQILEMQDESIDSFMTGFLKQLSHRKTSPNVIAEQLIEFVEGIGKESPVRRRRLKMVFNRVLGHLQNRIRTDSTGTNDAGLALRLCELQTQTLDALEQIDRNANLPFLIDVWAEKMT